MKTCCVDLYSILNTPEILLYEDEINIAKKDLEKLIDVDYKKHNKIHEYILQQRDKVNIIEECSTYKTTNYLKVLNNPDQYKLIEDKKSTYTGYKEIYLLDYPEDQQEKIVDLIYSTSSNREKVKVEKDLLEALGVDLNKNEYMILHVDDKNSYIYKKVGEFNLKLIDVKSLKKFSLKDNYQKLAYEACINPYTATIIDGPMGSGKTLISLLAAIHFLESKLFRSIKIIRPNIGIDKNYDIGFLPGSIEDKLNPWIGGIITNLTYIFGNETEAEKYMKTYIQNIPINMVQGYSIHDSVVIVDESQFLNMNLVKQIVSRIAESSKLIILYDEKQSYNITEFLGIKRIISTLPNDLFSYVKLKNIYRSKLTEFIEKF
ncbi:MAG: PhoH family protein [Thermoproteota archaeon]